MKKTFKDFIVENPNCGKFDGNSDAMLVFDFLSRDDIIIKMIDASEAGKPALMPCVLQLEQLLLGIKNPSISFDDNFTKQAVGLMVKSILEPFGYVVWKQKDIPKGSKFKSASVYRRDPNKKPTMRVVKHIEELDPLIAESETHHE